LAKLARILEYRRARFYQDDGQILDDGQNLEELVRQAWEKFETQVERTITFSEDRSTCGACARDVRGGGFAIHCVRFTNGQGVGTIPTAPAPQVDVGERLPEPGENFLSSDLMALFRANHVICMNCGLNAAVLRLYLQELFQKADLSNDRRQFEIVRIGSFDKVKIIKEVGVKSFDMGTGIAEATAVAINEDGRTGYRGQSIKRGLGDFLEAITAKDKSVKELRRSKGGTVRISINVPEGDLEEVKDFQDNLAKDIVEDEKADGFTIHLRDGTTIKPDEVSVRKQVKLEKAANSVNVFEAWDAMETYLGELEESGQLEA